MCQEKETESKMPDLTDERLYEIAAAYIAKQEAERFADLDADDADDADDSVDCSRRFKIRINRMFREKLRLDHAIYPEVDNAYERWRSKLVIKIHDRKEH